MIILLKILAIGSIPLVFLTLFLTTKRGVKIKLGSFLLFRDLIQKPFKERTLRPIILLLLRLIFAMLVALLILDPREASLPGKEISFFNPAGREGDKRQKPGSSEPHQRPAPLELEATPKALDKFDQDIYFLKSFVKNFRTKASKSKILFSPDEKALEKNSTGENLIIFPGVNQDIKIFSRWNNFFEFKKIVRNRQRFKGNSFQQKIYYQLSIKNNMTVRSELELEDNSPIAVSFSQENQRILIFTSSLASFWGELGISGIFIDVIERFLSKKERSREAVLFISQKGEKTKRVKSRFSTPFLFNIAVLIFALEAILFFVHLKYRKRKKLQKIVATSTIIFSLFFFPFSLPLDAKDFQFIELHLGGRSNKNFFAGLKKELERRTSIKVDPDYYQRLSADKLAKGFLPDLPYLWVMDCRVTSMKPARFLKVLSTFIKKGGIIFQDGCANEHNNGSSHFYTKLAQENSGSKKGLAVLDKDHAIYRSFYLLGQNLFYGYVTSLSTKRTSIILSRNNLRGKLLNDDEEAIKAAVNIVLYMLSGNYKSDQIHTRQILKRIKQRELFR